MKTSDSLTNKITSIRTGQKIGKNTKEPITVYCEIGNKVK